MASNDKASGPADESVEGSWSPRRAPAGKTTSTRAPADKDAGKGKDKGKEASAPDPDQLVEEIEATREELAETLDAIVDKVSPKKVASRTSKKVTAAVKEGAGDAATAVKATAQDATEAVKDGVAAVKEKVGGDDPVRSPLAPATSVELDAAVPVAPAATTGALADATLTTTQPPGAETPVYPAVLPPAAPSRVPVFAGAAAALGLLLLLRRRRNRR